MQTQKRFVILLETKGRKSHARGIKHTKKRRIAQIAYTLGSTKEKKRRSVMSLRRCIVKRNPYMGGGRKRRQADCDKIAKNAYAQEGEDCNRARRAAGVLRTAGGIKRRYSPATKKSRGRDRSVEKITLDTWAKSRKPDLPNLATAN